MRSATRCLLLWTVALLGHSLHAQWHHFDIPELPAAKALILFSKQAQCDVLFSYDDLLGIQSPALVGRHETKAALALLLAHSGYVAQRSAENKYVVSRPTPTVGTIQGRVLKPDGTPALNVEIKIPGTILSTVTDHKGQFTLVAVPADEHTMIALAEGFRPVQWENLAVPLAGILELEDQILQPANDPMQLERYVVVDQTTARESPALLALYPRQVIGNIDLPRTENDPLPFKIYDREQISRSGTVDLNDFLRRELLDSDASTLPPEQNSTQASFLAGSSNLNLRGFGADATIILVNGRRLPESSATVDGRLGAPDVNSIPLSLVEQIEVLPASASALYNGNPVGGVINIVLRPDINRTEISTTYTNALRGFDAPNSSVSLLHGSSLLQGRLHLRLNATVTQALPPTESELGYRQSNDRNLNSPDGSIYRATPNIRSSQGSPLFGPGTSDHTSVAPGANGQGGLSAFTSRAGMTNVAFFDPPGGFAASPDSIDNPFGRRQRRQSYFISVVYDALPWLQIGIDSIFTHTVVNRGYDVFRGDLSLAGNSPSNPFGQDIQISLNETAPALGESFSEAQLDLSSTLIGALIKLPANWQLSLDAQYARNVARYRGFAGVNPDRWQQLVDQGIYNPLRDTQSYGPPTEFYDRALVYYGQRNRFVKLGDYQAIDSAIRATNQNLSFPTGTATAAVGFDYRLTELSDYTQELRYADGNLAESPVRWRGRTLERLSVFGEFQAPLLPRRMLPTWIESFETDLAARYVMADTSRETNLAPTLGVKVDFKGGWALRGSATISNRYPTSAMSRRISTPSSGGPGINYAVIYDPKRNQTYSVEVNEDLNPNVVPEGAVTQSAGLLYHRGDIHRFRASLDFVDTRKENEILFLEPQTLLNLESNWPDRINRVTLPPGDIHAEGYVNSLLTGLINVASRHSQNWNATLDYTWMHCGSGRLDAYLRLVYFQNYLRKLYPTSPEIDELNAPDGSTSGLMRYRANFGSSWTGRSFGFGFDGHYYYHRILPESEWLGQGSDRINDFWQYDIYAQSELTKWLPGLADDHELTLQLRINNIFGRKFPRYAQDASGAGVQAYGDCAVASTRFP
ncbi:MAG: TonB-dependent receptor [Cephaloticoccus sp.]|nr:TonB-dependent receptor [Cephaloticoccus sp.]